MKKRLGFKKVDLTNCANSAAFSDFVAES